MSFENINTAVNASLDPAFTPRPTVAVSHDVPAPPSSTVPVPEAVVAPDEYKELYEAQKAETERLNSILAATRNIKPNVPESAKPLVRADQFKAQISPVLFLKLGRDVEGVGCRSRSYYGSGDAGHVWARL
jgi:hypothetical protein